MKDQLVEITQNPVLGRVLKQVGIKPPPSLNRSGQPWQDHMLGGRKILIGGTGKSCLALRHWFADSGARFLLSPQTQAVAFSEIEHLPLPSLDQISSESDMSGIFFDACGLSGVQGLARIYEFFQQVLSISNKLLRIVIISQDAQTANSVEERVFCRGLEGFMRSLAKELGPQGSTVQLLTVSECEDSKLCSRAGPFIQFFLSDHAAYITGQIVRVNNQVQAQFRTHLAGSLAGKTALVTGAAQGIGLAIARALAAEGVHVLCLDRPESSAALSALAQEIEGYAIPQTLGSEVSAKMVVDEIVRHGESCEILVHNAGITRDRSLRKMQKSQWDQVMDVNLRAVIDLTTQIDRAGLLRSGGSVVCLSSISGLAGNFGQCNYSAAKAGLIGFVEGLASELAPRGISVNAIAPGFIETPMTGQMPFVARQIARRMSSLKQGGEPQDVAEAVCFLASPCSMGMTGSVLRVCGGHMLGS